MIYSAFDTAGLDILEQKSAEVLRDDPELAGIIEHLLHEVKGIGAGLAAPQLGYHKRVIVLDLEGKGNYTVAINPRWAAGPQARTVESEERCLSVPDQTYLVPRKRNIFATWFDRNFVARSRRLEGFPAYLMQHEVDHLNGILICKKGRLLEAVG